MLYLEKVINTKKRFPGYVLIIRDGEKVSIGWEDARRFATENNCSIGSMHFNGEKIPWVVRRDLYELARFFNHQKRKIIVVNGDGDVLMHLVESFDSQKEKNDNNKTSVSKKTTPKARRQSVAEINRERKNNKNKKKKKRNIIIPGSVLDGKSSASYFKKANPVNTSARRYDVSERSKEIEERRSFVDSELYPQGVRYGDAFRFRKNKKRK